MKGEVGYNTVKWSTSMCCCCCCMSIGFEFYIASHIRFIFIMILVVDEQHWRALCHLTIHLCSPWFLVASIIVLTQLNLLRPPAFVKFHPIVQCNAKQCDAQAQYIHHCKLVPKDNGRHSDSGDFLNKRIDWAIESYFRKGLYWLWNVP